MTQNSLENWSIESLMEELDETSRHAVEKLDQGAYWSCRRRHPRHPCRRDCNVRYVAPGGSCVVCLEGRMRNLSRSGMGLLVRRTFSPGEAIEVEVIPPINTKVFMGGLVRFCRYVSNGYYEVGMEFKSVSSWAIFTNDPHLARHRASQWQEEDLERREKTKDETRPR